MKISEALDAIERLAKAQQAFTEAKYGYDGTKTYDVRYLHEAANALAKRIMDINPAVETDDIPF